MSWEAYRRAVDFVIGMLPSTASPASLAFVLVVPAIAATGVGIDFGTAYLAQQKLDSAARAAAEAAISQGRALRAARGELPVDELAAKGAGRADLVFNAQKPSVRDIATKVNIGPIGQKNVYEADVAYQASVGTVFLRLAGIGELKLSGSTQMRWVDRDALLDDRFASIETRVRQDGRVKLAALDDWSAGGRPRNFVSPSIVFADPSRYAGGPPPADVKVAIELDSDEGNGFISKRITAEQGLHQLRYWYRDLAASESIAPAWLCGTRALDVEWMKTRDASPAGDTNMVSAYLMPEAVGAPPLADASLGPAYRVDSCYSSGQRWIQRVVKIDIAARGDYRLVFRAEGKADGVGGAIAHPIFCRDPCTGDDGADRPPAPNLVWEADQLLFRDDFKPSERTGARPGWASLPSDWIVTPQNAAPRVAVGAETFVQLDARAGAGHENRRMSRAFLFTPGHYTLRYAYSVGASQTGKALCNYFGMPADPALAEKGATFTNLVSVYIDADRSVLHPVAVGPDETAQADWRNVAGAAETSFAGHRLPSLPRPSSAVDYCADQPDGAQAVREINFNILRPGYYWITFAAGGAADGAGGRIGHVELLARQSRDQGLWRIVSEATPWIPQVGAWLNMPTGAQGKAVFYKVQAQ